MFGEEDIIDELIDFFFAGTLTTQFATQTIVCHFATSSKSLGKVRNEFEYQMEDLLYEDASLKDLKKKELMKRITTFDTISSLTYLNQVVMEALRLRPPVL